VIATASTNKFSNSPLAELQHAKSSDGKHAASCTSPFGNAFNTSAFRSTKRRGTATLLNGALIKALMQGSQRAWWPAEFPNWFV
jgi:hypothetical protein